MQNKNIVLHLFPWLEKGNSNSSDLWKDQNNFSSISSNGEISEKVFFFQIKLMMKV